MKPIQAPVFNEDTAFWFIAHQVALGPRIPNSSAHNKTATFLEKRLKKYGWKVVVQNFEAFTFDNNRLQLKNIIGSYNPELKKRVLLAAHWDTRPFADKDPNDTNALFDGANDGASGVAVLLEIARVMNDTINAPVGVDIIFFDGEDWGEREGTQRAETLPEGLYSWWCLGSQHWSQHKHLEKYNPMYGILLDMVGGRRAQFMREGGSMKYAPHIVDKVWSTASRLGYSDYFIKQNVGAITDDHVFVSEIGKVPMIDIVPFHPGHGFFGDYHHTQKDNLNIISKETLKAVGSTLLHVIYSEEP